MRRIIKIGGSMLLRDDLATAVNNWLNKHPADQTWVVIGGGRLIDAMRELDNQHPMDPQNVHWTCVDLLTATARVAAQRFGWSLITTQAEWKLVLERRLEIDQPTGNTPTVIAPAVFYNHKPTASCNERSKAARLKLPDDWRTTTDSIAGLLAHLANADELVLLKSCPIPSSMSPTQLADAGIVDAAFPEIATLLKRVHVEQLL